MSALGGQGKGSPIEYNLRSQPLETGMDFRFHESEICKNRSFAKSCHLAIMAVIRKKRDTKCMANFETIQMVLEI